MVRAFYSMIILTFKVLLLLRRLSRGLLAKTLPKVTAEHGTCRLQVLHMRISRFSGTESSGLRR